MVHLIPDSDTPTIKQYLCLICCQVPIHAYLRADLLVSCDGIRLMTSSTHQNVVESRCFMTAQGLLDILFGKLFNVHITNLTANEVQLSKFMIVASTNNAPSSIIHAVMTSHVQRNGVVRPRRSVTQLVLYKLFTTSR